MGDNLEVLGANISSWDEAGWDFFESLPLSLPFLDFDAFLAYVRHAPRDG